MSGIISNNTDKDSGLVKTGEIGVEQLASDPGSPATGQLWYNTTSGVFKGFNGSANVTIDTTAD